MMESAGISTVQTVMRVGGIVWNYVLMLYIAAIYITAQIFRSHKTVTNPKSRKGQLAIVTGGTRGIGLKVVEQLLALDMHVLIGCRNPEKNIDLLKKLSAEFTNGKVEAMELDLCSLKSVRQFVNKFYETNQPLHLLVNNAGVMFPSYSLTEDGFESQLGVNYLGHFLLTELLLPKLKETGSPTQRARVVNVSSCAAFVGAIDFQDLNSKHVYSPHGSYSQSKLAQIIYTLSLQDRLRAEDACVTVNTLHPGVVSTDLYDNIILMKIIPLKILFKTSKQGSDTVVFAATSEDIEGIGGKYFENCGETEPPAPATDPKLQRKLYDESCKLVGLA